MPQTKNYVDDAIIEAYLSMPKDENGWVFSAEIQKKVAETVGATKLTVYNHIIKNPTIFDWKHSKMRLKKEYTGILEKGGISLDTPEEIAAHFQDKEAILDSIVEFFRPLPMGVDSEEVLSKIDTAKSELKDGIDETYKEVLRLMRENYQWNPS